MLHGTMLLASVYFVLFSFFSVNASGDDSIEFMPAIQLEDAVRGISVPKKPRFLVKDIRIGNTSVLDLFLISDSPVISKREYYSFRDEIITIRLKEERLLSRLKYISLTAVPDFLTVYLVDPQNDGALRWVREKASPVFGPGFSAQLIYPIEIDLPPCDRLTQVIFHGMHTQLDEKIAEITKTGQTEASVSLDYLFLLLQRGRLDAFMRKLGPIEKTCPGAFRLLSWARNEEVYGFEFKRYAVTPELGSVLDTISKSIAQYQRWQRYDFKISVVGYTDTAAVMKPEESKFYLDPARTGVKSLASRPHLEIHYRNCHGNHPVDGVPQYVDFFRSSGGQLVRSIIETNCELGAVRAYSATAFLLERLGRKNMQYEYATGGISPTGGAADLKRKVDLKIVVKAATKTKQ